MLSQQKNTNEKVKKNISKKAMITIFSMILIILLISTGMFVITKNSENKLQEVKEATVVDVTGLVIGEETIHKHIIETKYDETNHWEECIICGKKENIVNHTYVDNGWTLGTSCSENNVHKYSCECGYSYTTTTGRPSHDLKYVTVYSSFQQAVECQNNCGYVKLNHNCYKEDGSRISCTNLGKCKICNFNYTTTNASHLVTISDCENGKEARCARCNVLLGMVNYSKAIKLSNNSYRFQGSVTMKGENTFSDFINYNYFGGDYTISNEKNNINGTTLTFERTVTFNEYREKGGYFHTTIRRKNIIRAKYSIYNSCKCRLFRFRSTCNIKYNSRR